MKRRRLPQPGSRVTLHVNEEIATLLESVLVPNPQKSAQDAVRWARRVFASVLGNQRMRLDAARASMPKDIARILEELAQ